MNADGTLNLDKYVEVTVAFGKNETVVRSVAEKCQHLYKPTCEQSYLAHRCALGF